MQVYSRDSSVMTPYGAIITAMANWWRRGENFAAIRTYERLGIPIYDMVTAGTFEGGDFNVIEDGCVLIGCGGGRTQEEGARQVEAWFKKEGWETRLAFFDEYYVHIDLMVVPIAPKLTAVCLACTEPGIVSWLKSKGHEIIDVPFEDTVNLGCNFMSLGRDRAIVPKSSRSLIQPSRAWLRSGGSGHERNLEDRRRHPLHGTGAAPRPERAGIGRRLSGPGQPNAMDNVTHTMIGFIAGEAVFEHSKRTPRKDGAPAGLPVRARQTALVAVGIAGSNLPDLDLLWSLWRRLREPSGLYAPASGLHAHDHRVCGAGAPAVRMR